MHIQGYCTPYRYCSVLNNRPVWLFGTFAQMKFHFVLNSMVLVLRSSNFGQMPNFQWGISLNYKEGHCLPKSHILMPWLSPRMIIRSGLLLGTLQYVQCEKETKIDAVVQWPAYLMTESWQTSPVYVSVLVLLDPAPSYQLFVFRSTGWPGRTGVRMLVFGAAVPTIDPEAIGRQRRVHQGRGG